MGEIRLIEVKEEILADNEAGAAQIRERLKRSRTFLLNLMSSPGAGKTTLILRTIGALKADVRLAVIEADIASQVDAERVGKTGVPVVQLHTGGACHVDAAMVSQGLDALDLSAIDLIILENVGNLVCPAEFATGSTRNAMILSVPEGDDKPLKYPLMFSVSEALLINKIDCLPLSDFDLKAVKDRARRLNPEMKIFEISAKTGKGVEAWIGWLREEVAKLAREQ